MLTASSLSSPFEDIWQVSKHLSLAFLEVRAFLLFILVGLTLAYIFEIWDFQVSTDAVFDKLYLYPRIKHNNIYFCIKIYR